MAEDYRELAALHGVATSYRDASGQEVEVSQDTVRKVLASLGVSATNHVAVREEIRRSQERTRGDSLPDFIVLRGDRRRVRLPVYPRTSEVDILTEDNVVLEVGLSRAQRELLLPPDLPVGYHTLRLRGHDHDQDVLILRAPEECPSFGDERRWGWMAQLYACRSRESWGIGDFIDLATLASESAQRFGCAFVLSSPAAAAAPTEPQQPSPYYPSSRQYFNPIYLRVEGVLESSSGAADVALLVRRLGEEGRSLTRSPRIERDAIYRMKIEALEAIYRLPRSRVQTRKFDEYRRREGESLERFATFCALAERHGMPYQTWPEAFRSPEGARASMSADLRDRVDFHCWLQWLCDQQLGLAQRTALDAGMPVGIIHDLPVGVDPGGADAWAQQQDIAQGMSIGAPPDPFNAAGQNWGAPPWNPRRLGPTGFRNYRLMLESALRHSGGLRIDHALGLFRLYWIPEGASAAEGTYVRYPAEAMLACLAIEAFRAHAGVIGEDLGTLEEGTRKTLRDWGIYGSAVLPFERRSDGRLRSPGQYRERALASLSTHDLPTAAGFWTSTALDARSEAGLIRSDDDREREQIEHRSNQDALSRALKARRLLGAEPDLPERVRAVHTFIGESRSALAATGLTDALMDQRQPNLPGTENEYPNWRLPLAASDGRPLLLHEVLAHPHVLANLKALRKGRERAR